MIQKNKQGFFVVLDEEEVETLKKNQKLKVGLNVGRLGIYHEKDELTSTLSNNMALAGKKMHIVEVSVPDYAISTANNKKFGVKGGNNIPIIEIKEFKHQLEVA